MPRCHGTHRSSPDVDPTSGAAVFDLDNTLVHGSSLFHFATFMARRRALRFGMVARFALDETLYARGRGESARAPMRAAEAALGLVCGLPQVAMAALADEFVNRRSGRMLAASVVCEIERFQTLGVPCFIATASPQELADSFAKQLGMDCAFGTVSEIKDGTYTGRLDGPICHGAAKAHRVRNALASRGLDLAQSTVFSDSVNDLPLLSLARTPIAVSPDRALDRIARTNGWRVLRRTRNHPTLAETMGQSLYYSFPFPM
jgi:HAD superfamily hydrolase (TIGR01490 family)